MTGNCLLGVFIGKTREEENLTQYRTKTPFSVMESLANAAYSINKFYHHCRRQEQLDKYISQL